MLSFLSILISLFLAILGLVAIYIGIRIYIHLSTARVTTGGDVASDSHIFLIWGLTEVDIPIFFPSRPLCTLACVTVIGLLPLSFGILLFVRMVGLF